MYVGGTLGSKELNCHLQWKKWFNHKVILCSSGYALLCVYFFFFQILLSFMISHPKMARLSFRNKVSLGHHLKWNGMLPSVTYVTKALGIQGDNVEHWSTHSPPERQEAAHSRHSHIPPWMPFLSVLILSIMQVSKTDLLISLSLEHLEHPVWNFLLILFWLGLLGCMWENLAQTAQS